MGLIRAGRCDRAPGLLSYRERAGDRGFARRPMKEVTMPDPIADFFAELAQGGAGPLLGDVTATVRFDVTYPGYVRIWRVAIDGDRIEVTDSAAGADCVVGAE